MSKNNYRILNIKGAVLDRNQLEQYLERIAANHNLQPFSNVKTYPIPRLKDNFKVISKTYNLLNEHIKMGIDLNPAGEWLLDNFYVIEETVKIIIKDITQKKYKSFVGIANGEYQGFARTFVLASEIVAYTDSKIDSDNLRCALNAYQRKKTLSMEEIWSLPLFLEISIIENIRQICEKIYSSQIQKYRVESIVERLVEKKEYKNQLFKQSKDDLPKEITYKEMKYPFIEYMSYKLKKYGKQGLIYLEILEEQVNKMGSTIGEVIKREHFLIATTKVSIGNSITSIKEILRLNIIDVFEEINGVEDILKKDPSEVYERMDYRTKEYYRQKIEEISKKTKISEIYIASKALELANSAEENQEKKRHVGYYLIDEGINDLINCLQVKKYYNKSAFSKSKKYILWFAIIPVILTLLAGVLINTINSNMYISIILSLLLYIPITEVYIQIANYILGKVTKAKRIPKLDFSNGIPSECATMIVIPTIVKDSKKVKELMRKLEVCYLGNKSDNIYLCLLGDAAASSNEFEIYDEEVQRAGLEAIEELNKKYKNDEFPIFNFVYRKRYWNSSEKCYLGWERKRGLLSQFNDFLLTGEDDFKINTMRKLKTPKIKYVITLDADTDLVLNSGLELVGAMAHILNKPELNNTNDAVISGHALMQPRVGIDLDSSRKSIFTKIYAGLGGVDSYSAAISDVYQDNFNEGIFTGKGIYDLKIFHEVLQNEIPENTVLSHDLLEGSYLRCALVNDIMLLDGYPYKYNAFMGRNHRWIRGDWQIIRWLKANIRNKKQEKKKNPLNKLSKFKIFDNLRRSLLPVASLIAIVCAILAKSYFSTEVWPVILISIIAMCIPTIIDLLNYIIFKKDVGRESINAYKSFSNKITRLQASVYRGILEIAFLPHKAYISINAILKTIYRVYISKQNLLEWTTAEEAEKQAKTDILSYYKFMMPNVILSVLGFLLSYNTENYFVLFLSLLWLIAPSIACFMSKEIKPKRVDLKKEDIEYIFEIGKKTWCYFKDNINEENNYLPPDNYQEDRTDVIAHRTSSTNIGLGMLSIVSAYDLKYIDINEAVELLYRMSQTVQSLEKWNGHLYNWYDTKTLKPLSPRYISSVDSGNFVGYMYVLKEFLKEIYDIETVNKQKIEEMLIIVESLINDTDFSVLFDYKKRLLSIGFNIEENKLTDSYYDLLASEARQASFIAIAKKDIPAKHWNNLSRTLTSLNKYKGLISWSGTAFEYLMPTVNMKRYEGSLIDESCKFMIMSQREYAKRLGIPWGISESAYNVKDLNSNYQYKAFGIPWLGLKRGLADDMVVSSYGLILALLDAPQEVINNLKILEAEDMLGKYGFYESIDYTASRVKYGKKNSPVKTYMAHHQGLILLTINNFLNEKVLQERFYKNPEIEALDILLQERMPEKAIITKEKKEKVEKIKLKPHDNYTVKVYTKVNEPLLKTNTISNGNYTICMTDRGESFSKCGNIFVNRFKETSDYEQGIFFYIKNINSKRIWTNAYMNYLNRADKYNIQFAPDMNKIVRVDGGIETVTKITVAPNDNVELRRLELKNNGTKEEILEITSCFEPVLSTKEQDYAHQAFNNLFLTYEAIDDGLIIRRRHRGQNEKDIYLGARLFTKEETIGDFEYEIDKAKFIGRNNIGLPVMIKESKPFDKSLELVTDSVSAMKKTVKIMPGQTVIIDLVIAISAKPKEVLEKIDKYTNREKITEAFSLSFAKTEAESMYLGINGANIETYQKMLTYLLFQNPMKKLDLEKMPKHTYYQNELWKYGISGDLPILLVKIKMINDIFVIKEILKAYEFFRAKNINVDIVILNEEENVYEQYVKEEIETAILDSQLNFLKNINIFVLNKKEITKEDEELLMFRANLVLDATLGNIDLQINEKEEEFEDRQVNIGFENVNKYIPEEPENINLENMDNLKYYNEYGGFSEDGAQYLIKVNKNSTPPTVWSNILANENFGTIVTDNLGGYTWSKNSRLNRLTVLNNNPTIDIPSEIIYMKDKQTNKIWRLGEKTNQDYYLTYGFGYVNYKSVADGILQELDIFVPREDKVKVNLLKLKNTTNEKKKLTIVYYVNPVLGEDEINSNGYIDLEKNSSVIFARNLYNSLQKERVVYVACSQRISSYTGSKDFFVGSKTLDNPESIYRVSLDNQNSLGVKPCIAIEIEVDLDSYESKKIAISLGEEDNILDAKNSSYKYSNITNCKEELTVVKNFWYELLNRVQVKTPIESLNIILNGWLVYQTLASRLWGRTGYYQSGGATGFRDQLQDTLGLKYIDINFMKEQIIKQCAHQFIEGDVEHWWHDETSRGIRTRFSDDLLWLCYVVAEYINTTEDYSILEKEVPYLGGEPLRDGEDEKYDKHEALSVTGTVYEHCIKAIDKSLQFGKNGLPKIGSGDWNDGFNTVGNKGEGESVWLAFFLYDILEKFVQIAKVKEDLEVADKYEKTKENLKRTINNNAWDGRWYKRAYCDDGSVLGSIENEECRIDSISQSWSVISNAGDNDKKYISMESLENHLVDKEHGIIKLLDPPFDKGKLEPGYIKSYLPGVRENGGQYTHAAVWVVIALSILGFGDKALEYYKMINPIEHAQTKEAANKYRVEPYVIAGDVYGVGNLAGRGGWTWYTGSSGWFYKAGIEYILGLKVKNNALKIEPSIPKDWKEYSIRYRYKSSIYNIKVKNPNAKQGGVEKFILNGAEIQEKQVKLIDDGSINEIEIIM